MFSVHIIIIYRYVFRKYYTDYHDVDEDQATIPYYGGSFGGKSDAGVVYRSPLNIPSHTSDVVASKK